MERAARTWSEWSRESAALGSNVLRGASRRQDGMRRRIAKLRSIPVEHAHHSKTKSASCECQRRARTALAHAGVRAGGKRRLRVQHRAVSSYRGARRCRLRRGGNKSYRLPYRAGAANGAMRHFPRVWQRFGEATTFAWLQRRTGKYLQSSVNYHGTKAVTEISRRAGNHTARLRHQANQDPL
jgi:hypothetical protein